MRRVLAVVILAAACTGVDPPDAPDRVGGEVSFLVFGEPEELKAFRAVVAEFERREPTAEVELIEASDRDDLLARLSTSFAGGTPPDLFLLNYRFYGQFATRGVLEPVGPRVDASDAFDREDFYPKALEAFTLDGKLICLPQNISSLVVYYNEDLLREARLPPPPDVWTWDDMAFMAEVMTVDEDGDGNPEQYGLGVEASIIRLAPFIWSNGGELVDDPVHPTRFTISSPEAIEAIQRFLDLRRARVIPSDREIEAQDDETRFLNGTTAMVMASRRETPSFRTITDFEWDIAPLPILREPAGILHSDAYCMTRASDNKGTAWAFMEFALSPEGQEITARSGRTVPSLIEVANSPAFLDPDLPPDNARVFLDTIPVIRRVPSISSWPEIEDVSEGILETGLYEDVPAEVVARRLIEETQDIFARAQT